MISTLLSISAADARQRLRRAYDAIDDHARRPIVLFGCGPLGRRTAAALTAAHRPPVAFADNNPTKWGATAEDIPVLSPVAALAAYGQTAIFVVTIYNSAAACAQLAALGCRHVLPFASFYHGQPEVLLPWCDLDDPAELLRAGTDILAAAGLWADDASRAEYAAQIAWRLGLPAPALAAHDPPAECYFPPDLVRLGDDSLVVDCGAFDGDSLRLLLGRGGPFGGFLGLEPDPQTYIRLTAFIATLPPAIRRKITARQCAVAAVNASLRFDAAGSVASSVSAAGGTQVAAVTLDHLLAGQRAGLIKMDIEGAEPEALRGAARTLVSDRPILAISAYHRGSDLWVIPLLIKSIVPDYDLYLRRYAEDCWELVCYAIPASSPMAA